MRDRRAIIVTNPRLRRIRNNLRNLIIQAYHSHWNKLFDELEGISRDNSGAPISVDDMPPRERERFRSIQIEQSKLSNSLDRSILICVTCGKGERDMVYNKPYDAWYCTECYGLELSVAKVRRQGARSKACWEKTIEGHSKTFL